MPDADRLDAGVERVWGSNGPLAQALPGFEPRPQQIAMARAVSNALASDRTLLVEAGTGTGKTLAYLIPAVLSGKKVVVSTGTRALQDQLAGHDVPLVERVLGRAVDWCVLKGRENYVCLYRLEDAAGPAGRSSPSDPAVDAIRAWAVETHTGDRAELEWLGDDDPLWARVSVTAEQCLGASCPRYEPCFLTTIKRRAARADLVIVNHALFFADLAAGPHASGSIVPRHAAVIFDEAHVIEDVATAHWGVSVSRHRVRDLLADIRREPLPDDAPSTAFHGTVDRVHAAADRAFDALRAAAGSDAGPRARWMPDHAERAAGAGLDMLARLAEFRDMLDGVSGRSDGWARLAERVGALARDARFLWRAEDPAFVFWIEVNGASVRLSASPLDVSAILRETLFSGGAPCVLTSATLTAGGSFEYVRSRLGIDHADERALASPFDFRTQSLLYVPEAFPLPRDPDFVDAVAEEVVRVVSASRGRAFILFTSRRMLERVSDSCRRRMGYPVLRQGEAPRMALIQRFKAEPSVLFATMGFWQGIDVPGDALSCVVLDKLPFAPPDDPVVEARTAALKAEGLDPFTSYQLPTAAIWLKQGFGRLIRSRRDRGVIAILDRRLLTHRYGRFFLDSLPPAPLTTSFLDVERFFSSDGDVLSPADQVISSTHTLSLSHEGSDG
ncbi:MAG: ATP-dependent DNA helicase [Nitrospirota bacterium]